jgi:hypothetical protein
MESSKGIAESAPWYRKVLLVVLFPFILPAILLVFLILSLMGGYAIVANYLSERRLKSRMKRRGRYLRISDARRRIESDGGTLLIEAPSLGWNFTRAWWTPNDLLEESPFPLPEGDDYKTAVKHMRCLEWDRWCWDNYICEDDGKAYLLRVWNGESVKRKFRESSPNLKVVRTWTALVHFPIPPETLGTDAA